MATQVTNGDDSSQFGYRAYRFCFQETVEAISADHGQSVAIAKPATHQRRSPLTSLADVALALIWPRR
jgi:hypothetical protein